GCRPGQPCHPPSKAAVERTVERALVMGADPYVALAYVALERADALEGTDTMLLDPIIQYRAMGCKVEAVPQSDPRPTTIYGYSSYNYDVKPTEDRPIQNAMLSKRLLRFLAGKQMAFDSSRKSYYCRSTAPNRSWTWVNATIAVGPLPQSC